MLGMHRPRSARAFALRRLIILGPAAVATNSLGSAPVRASQTPEPVGCYRFDRPLGHSAAGTAERNDSTWYSLRLLPAGAVARPELASPIWRDQYAARSSWRAARDTVFIRVSTGLVGWDVALAGHDSQYVGTARYLTDAVGGPPITTAVHAKREACPVGRSG